MADFLTVHQNIGSWPIYCFHLDIIKDYKESWTYSTLLSELNEGSLFYLIFDYSTKLSKVQRHSLI